MAAIRPNSCVIGRDSDAPRIVGWSAHHSYPLLGEWARSPLTQKLATASGFELCPGLRRARATPSSLMILRRFGDGIHSEAISLRLSATLVTV